MIALISFESALAIPKDEAISLGLNYKNTEIAVDYNGKYCEKQNYYHYIDELELRENDDKKEYYLNDKKIDSYYIVKRLLADHNLVWIEKENHLVDLIPFAPTCKYKFYILKTVKSEEPSISNINLILSDIEQKTEKINKTIDILQNSSFNQKVNVHVGGGLITTYNELCLKSDTCTDLLQTELNNGWRIIAVCVQPDQRRPDYILGRYNPQLEVTNKNSASR